VNRPTMLLGLAAALNSCFTGSGRVRALRRNLWPIMPRAGARVPPGPKFGKAGTLAELSRTVGQVS
jgi:hypothetical protein